MRIAITGHTGGLGTELGKIFSEGGHTLFGFSRSNGWDLSQTNTLERVCVTLSQCDIIINNAPGSFQTDLFLKLLNSQTHDNKAVIVNVSSVASRFSISRSQQYAANKASLDMVTLSHQRFGNRWPAALLVRPGYFTGTRSEHKPPPHIDVSHVANIIRDITLAAHSDTYRINEITIEK